MEKSEKTGIFLNFKNRLKEKFPSVRRIARACLDVPQCLFNDSSKVARKKQEIILGYAKKFGISIFVETGTCQGDMVEAVRNDFARVTSIELDDNLYLKAKQRFENCKNVEILHGDSGVVLRQVVPLINAPALFWLDGHYSGEGTAKGDTETPIMAELETICSSGLRHVVLIDDARLFTGNGDYPSISELEKYVRDRKKSIIFEINDGIIRLTPGL